MIKLYKKIIENLSIPNHYYQTALNKIIKFLEKIKNFFNNEKNNKIFDNLYDIFSEFLKLPLFIISYLFNFLVDSFKNQIHITEDDYFQYIPKFIFRKKYNTLFNKYKESQEFKQIKIQWITLIKSLFIQPLNDHNLKTLIKKINIFVHKILQETKEFLKIPFLTSRGKGNIREFLNNNNYYQEDL